MNEIFIRGLENRKHDPIKHGLFKLKELNSRMRRVRDELNVIHQIHIGEQDQWGLSFCTYDDAHIWMKKIPEIIIYESANKIMSSIDALKNEGIPENNISMIRQLVSDDIVKLLESCELITVAIKSQSFSWEKEWGYAEHSLQKLIIQFICILDVIIQISEQCLSMGIRENKKIRLPMTAAPSVFLF
jgi:hypothetical protein